MPPSVSVVMPVHNGGPYVGPAIESVLAQTETAWELLVVDDGSTDGTAAALEPYAAHPAITVMRQPQAGVAAARNRGVRAATAQWVALLDADDVWRPNYLSVMLPALRADPGAAAAFAGWQYMNADGTPLPQRVVLAAEAAATLPDDLTWRNALVPSGAVVRRAALEQAGGFDPALAGTEDWDLWLRLAPLGRFIIIPQALVLYRTHAENTSDKIEAMEANSWKLLQKHLGPLPVDPTTGTRPQRRALGALWFNAALGYFRQEQPSTARAKLVQALTTWPDYMEQAEFYYELACAYQPRGRRGQPGEAGLAEGAALLQDVVRDGDAPPATAAQRRAWWGQASLVLARLMKTDRRTARHYAAQAMQHGDRRVKAAAARAWLRAALPAGSAHHDQANDAEAWAAEMKLLYLTNGYPPNHTAGTESYTAALATAFAQAGHTVRVVCGGDWDSGPLPYNGRQQREQAGVVVDRLNLNWTRGPDPNGALFDNWATEAVVAEILAEYQPDLVHLTSTYTLSASVLRVVAASGRPLVVTLTDFWFICPQVTLRRSDGQLCDGRTTAWECLRCLLGPSRAYQRAAAVLPEAMLAPLLTWASQHANVSRQRGLRGLALDMTARKATLLPLLEQAAAIIAPSHILADLYRSNGLRQAARVIPYGHDLGWTAQVRPRPSGAGLVFGYVGRLTEAKGVHVLVEAATRLDPASEAEVHLYGDVEAEPEYVARLRALAGDSPRVRFKGKFGREALAQVYSGLDVLVVPSLWYENNPLVIQEAFAAGRPVIASDLGGMAEFTAHGVNGLLFEAGNAGALAAAMQRLATDRTLLTRLSAGLPPVRQMKEEVQAISAIYAEVVAAAPLHA